MTVRADRGVPPAVLLAGVGVLLALASLALPWLGSSASSDGTGSETVVFVTGSHRGYAIDPLWALVRVIVMAGVGSACVQWIRGRAEDETLVRSLAGAAVVSAYKPVRILLAGPSDLWSSYEPGIGVYVSIAGSVMLGGAAFVAYRATQAPGGVSNAATQGSGAPVFATHAALSAMRGPLPPATLEAWSRPFVPGMGAMQQGDPEGVGTPITAGRGAGALAHPAAPVGTYGAPAGPYGAPASAYAAAPLAPVALPAQHDGAPVANAPMFAAVPETSEAYGVPLPVGNARTEHQLPAGTPTLQAGFTAAAPPTPPMQGSPREEPAAYGVPAPQVVASAPPAPAPQAALRTTAGPHVPMPVAQASAGAYGAEGPTRLEASITVEDRYAPKRAAPAPHVGLVPRPAPATPAAPPPPLPPRPVTERRSGSVAPPGFS